MNLCSCFWFIYQSALQTNLLISEGKWVKTEGDMEDMMDVLLLCLPVSKDGVYHADLSLLTGFLLLATGEHKAAR